MQNYEIQKVVNKPIKVDLHIHSIYSRGKDDSKVNGNTLENLSILVEKLNKYGINMCAITDHDNFNCELYTRLKEEEYKGSIVKVLPGIEFSVKIKNLDSDEDIENGGKKLVPVHIVVIFDDADTAKIGNIEKVLKKYKYTDGTYFNESTFLEILADIDVNVVMIAHQKESMTSNKKRQNDANTVGDTRFNEFLFSGYFEAFEFRNTKNEIFNNVYLFENRLEEQIRFITSTDCHVWESYPNGDIGETGEISFTYLKCLPTFKGLAMALTDHSRMRMNDNFFTVNSDSYIDNIVMSIDDKRTTIPMSKGINVIIGDNSVGKSMFIHSLSDYEYIGQLPTKKLKEKYIEYLSENKVHLSTKIPKNRVFEFDSQDEVRRKFSEKKLDSNNFFEEKYPDGLSTKIYGDKISEYFASIFNEIRLNIKINEAIERLPVIEVPKIEIHPNSLTIAKIDANYNNYITAINSLITQLKLTIESNNKLIASQNHEFLRRNNLFFSEDEVKKISEYSGFLVKLSERKAQDSSGYDFLNHKINTIDIVLGDINTQVNYAKKSVESVFTQFAVDTQAFAKTIIELKNILLEQVPQLEHKFEEIVLRPNINKYDKYNFVSKVNEDYITQDMLEKWLSDLFIKNTKLSAITTTEQLRNSISRYDENYVNPFEFLNTKVSNKIETALKEKKIINIGDTDLDKRRELSQGFNSKIYFDLLSFDEYKKGVYIIDQPEDNVSQKAIKDNLIKNFKEMAKRRQLIIVTHNPQFVVNLDADNIIFLSKVVTNDNIEKINVYSGALEYECDDYSVLKIIEENLDGGLETIRKRLRRYDKN